MPATPIDLLRNQAKTIIGALPRLHDGDIEAVHDARVASRRIREVLPLTGDWYPQGVIDDFAGTFKRIGRNLGRVRDADARIALLAYLETRIPPAAAPLLALQREQERDRLRLLRKLIKRFERREVARVLDKIAAGPVRNWWPWATSGSRWPGELRGATAERAAATREAVEHATGVYFPNRSHQTRIALKKFRYALEIACATGGSAAMRDALRHLKKAQDVLGDLHDRHVLVDDLPKEATPELDINATHLRLVTEVVGAECRDLYARFLRRRPQLLEICRRFERVHRRRVAIAPAAAAVVISSAFYVWRHARMSRPRLRDRGVSVRIPIPDALPASR